MNRLPYLVTVAVYLASIALVDPRGEFPLNDDWSYTRTAFSFAAGNGMRVDEWSAPSLVGQAFYGGLLVKIFGRSFLALRLSTLALSCGIALLVWMILRCFRVRADVAWLCLLAWVFNPIQFCLSFTYMTEIPSLFFITLALFLFFIFLRAGKVWLLPACGAGLGYAFLIRQTAALFLMALIGSLLFGQTQERLRQRLAQSAAVAGSAALFIVGYLAWSLKVAGTTPAAGRKWELLSRLTSKQVVGNSFGLLFYLSFFLLPLLIYLVPSVVRMGRKLGKRVWVGALICWVLFACCGLWWFHVHYARFPYLPSGAYHARMPFLLNVLYDTGLGPVTLDPTYYGSPATPVYPRIWLGITVLVAAGLVVMGLLCTFRLIRVATARTDPRLTVGLLFAVLSVLAVASFEIVFSHFEEGGLFDRHLLAAALPLSLAIVMTQESGDELSKERRKTHPLPAVSAVTVLVVLAFFCISATHDYLAWNRIRWDMGNELLAKNVNPLTISGGFEFNGWHNYDTFRARGHVGKIYYWWYDDPVYIISMKPEEGYRILRKEEYFSWIHRRDIPLYLQEKSGLP